MATTYDIIENSTKARIFKSTLNSKGTIRISIVDNPDARNYKEGDLLYQKTFSDWRSIPQKEMDLINSHLYDESGGAS